MRAHKVTTFIMLLGILLTGRSLRCEEKKWDWLKAAPVPCPGVGVNGAYRSFALADVNSTADGGKEIPTLRVYINSAAVSIGPTTISASVTIRPKTGEAKTVTLTRPSSAAIEPARDTNDSNSLYLPAGTKLAIPKGATIEITVSAQLQTTSGACSLGTSKKTIDPF